MKATKVKTILEFSGILNSGYQLWFLGQFQNIIFYQIWFLSHFQNIFFYQLWF